jgi:hypothetical protein
VGCSGAVVDCGCGIEESYADVGFGEQESEDET